MKKTNFYTQLQTILAVTFTDPASTVEPDAIHRVLHADPVSIIHNGVLALLQLNNCRSAKFPVAPDPLCL